MWVWMRVRARRLVCGAAGGGDAGMTTSEYAMGTIAACAFAAVLYKVVTSDMVAGALEAVVGRALNVPF
ncbi:DUF4244 domain-containing protein [Streptomyces sp. ISL-100]|uniref:DUF4244 domain-containing protein n=1 Tax=Streptomyces sp. ISL-100 TaxID=2819173 RepID=UPI001BE8F6E7|nr:DUF4244 domain-containing protein [Streptomyces sp. ISL-100]MBT2399282.1 DUF4244 domain-containing protein [Streptomyces sp. ISL-100]